MSEPEITSSRPFSFGRVFGQGLSIYGRNFLPYTLLSLLIYAPVIVWVLLMIEGIVSYSTGSLIVTGILTVVGQCLVTGILFFTTTEVLRGHKANVGRGFAVALRRLPSILAVALLSAIGAGVGALLFIIPGLIVLTMLWVAIPVTVVEKRGPIESLSRSWELVTGNGWSVFGAIIIFWVLENAPELILKGRFEAGTIEPMVYFLVPVVIGVFVAAANATVTAVGYHELRISKEGVDTEEIASAFD